MGKLYNNFTEAEIQFELGNRLLEKGYSVYFERNFDLPFYKKTKRKNKVSQLRADIVVAHNHNVVCLIEVKNHLSEGSTDTRQHYKYESLGIPFFFCWNEDYMEEALEFCLKVFNPKQV